MASATQHLLPADISAIVLDLDGTLLNSQALVSARNRAALEACRRAGIPVFLATARPQRLSRQLLQNGREDPPPPPSGAFYNGAMAIDASSGYVRHWSLPAALVQDIAQHLAAAAPTVQIALQAGEEYHSFRLPIDDSSLQMWGFHRHELLPFDQAMGMTCSKICIFDPSADLDDLYRVLADRFGPAASIFLTDSRRWIQLMAKDAAKERALLDLFARRRIDPRKVVVFGDDWPDAGMFRTFGHSIAMANAPDALKRLATHVTGTNDEDSVALALAGYCGIR